MTILSAIAVFGCSRSGVNRSPAMVVWVDYDRAPARAVYAEFARHLNALSLERTSLVSTRFFGTDVADDAGLDADMQRLAAQQPSVVIATSVAVAKSFQKLATRIPVYYIIQSDPASDGLIAPPNEESRATGYSFFVPLDLKTLEVIKRIFPTFRKVGILVDALWREEPHLRDELVAQGQGMGLQVEIFQLINEHEIRNLPEDRRSATIDIWYIPYGELPFDHGPVLSEVLNQTIIPTVYGRRKYLGLGGFMSIQAVDPDAMNSWARSILNIVDGVQIAHIPVMRPKEIEIAVNALAIARFDRPTRERIAREVTVFE